MRVVTINDEPYNFINDKFIDTDTGQCTEGLLCSFQTKHGPNNTKTTKQTCCIGFIPDVFKLILKQVVIPFEIYIVEDGKYGGLKNGRWNGMMADVVYGKADLALAPLTITRERMDYADFTTPYLFDQTGIISKPQAVEVGFLNWEFLAPLSDELEWTVAGVMIFTMLLSYILENAVFFYASRNRDYHYRGQASKIYYSFLESISYISGVTLQRDLGAVSYTHLTLPTICSV